MEETYGKVISKGAARRNWALGNASRAIHVVGAVLEQAVKVQRGALVAELVVDVDDEAVAHVDLETRNGPLAVDANDGTLHGAVRVGGDPGDVEVMGDGGGVGERCCAGEGEQGRFESHGSGRKYTKSVWFGIGVFGER